MELDYQTLRAFADSWGLLAMTVAFLALVAFAFRPGSARIAERVARIPLQED